MNFSFLFFPFIYHQAKNNMYNKNIYEQAFVDYTYYTISHNNYKLLYGLLAFEDQKKG